MTEAQIVGIVLAAATLVVAVIAWLSVRLFKRLSSANGRPSSLLVPALVATLLVPSVVPAIAAFIVQGTSVALQEASTVIVITIETVRSCIASGTTSDLCNQLATSLVQRAGRGLVTVVRTIGIDTFNYWIAAVWLLVAIGTRRLMQGESMDSPMSQGEWVLHRWNALPAYQRQNAMLGLVLVVAMYLSVASLAALPALEEVDTPGPATQERLAGELVLPALRPSAEDLFRNDPFDALSVQLRAARQPLAEDASVKSGTEAPTAQATALPSSLPLKASDIAFDSTIVSVAEDERDFHQGRRDALQRTYSQLLEDLGKHLLGSRQRGLSRFEISNAERKGNRERKEHFSALIDWYVGEANRRQTQLKACVGVMVVLDQYWRTWSNEYLEILKAPQNGGSRLRDVEKSLMERYGDAALACEADQSEVPLPDRQPPGSYLGPFGPIAAWLVRTESASLMLVVGMLGFGCLGATISSIVRERQSTAPGTPLVSDLASVIVRGLSAAIVVFLAAKGGLDVFAAGTPEPNPYVMLLTCLIAAVFSEPVWLWARNYLGRLVEAHSDDSPGSPPPQKAAN